MKMQKTVLLVIIASLLLGGCFRKQYQRSITPEIERIDGVIFGEGGAKNNLLHHPVRSIYGDPFWSPFSSGEEKIKTGERIVSNRLTSVYQDVPLDTIKQEFIDIQSPCNEISSTHLICEYRILGYVNRWPPQPRYFVRVTLDFQREDNQTMVSYIAFRCTQICYGAKAEIDLALEVVNYFKQLKPRKLVFNLGDTEEFYQRSITPGIGRIDKIIFNEEIGYSPEHNLLYRPVRNLHPDHLRMQPFRHRAHYERDIEGYGKIIGETLSKAYKDIPLEAIKQEFADIQSPCKEIFSDRLRCDYKILGYVGENSPFTRDFVKVTLDFRRVDNQTLVSFVAFRCYEDLGDCRDVKETRDLALEVHHYFKKLKPEELIGNLSDMEDYVEAGK